MGELSGYSRLAFWVSLMLETRLYGVHKLPIAASSIHCSAACTRFVSNKPSALRLHQSGADITSAHPLPVHTW